MKCFTLTESSTGYCLGINVYTGKQNGIMCKNVGKKAVMNLISPFLNKGHTAFMNNYHSSINIFEQVESQGLLQMGLCKQTEGGGEATKGYHQSKK